ncbi:hypothetical protein ACFU99_22560 [Streptomyces sp. NPDC057654]|uniref:hypothetical protein n=1 Tax=Streptomyces sp. NPDC057654 TaxID=3346196 RepID=UPI0036B24FA6
MALQLHPGLRLNTQAWDGVKLTPSNRRMAAIMDEIGPAVLGRAVAIHEAGHAVIGLVTGHHISELRLTGNGLNHGQTSWTRGPDTSLEDHLVMVAAGLAAQVRWLRELRASRQVLAYVERQADGDQEHARLVVRDYGLDRDVLRRAERRASELLTPHWKRIDELAYRLDLDNIVTGERTIRRIVGM